MNVDSVFSFLPSQVVLKRDVISAYVHITSYMYLALLLMQSISSTPYCTANSFHMQGLATFICENDKNTPYGYSRGVHFAHSPAYNKKHNNQNPCISLLNLVYPLISEDPFLDIDYNDPVYVVVRYCVVVCVPLLDTLTCSRNVSFCSLNKHSDVREVPYLVRMNTCTCISTPILFSVNYKYYQKWNHGTQYRLSIIKPKFSKILLLLCSIHN